MPVMPFEMSMGLSTVKGGGSGTPGKDGKSAYQVWLDLGNEEPRKILSILLKAQRGQRGSKAGRVMQGQ